MYFHNFLFDLCKKSPKKAKCNFKSMLAQRFVNSNFKWKIAPVNYVKHAYLCHVIKVLSRNKTFWKIGICKLWVNMSLITWPFPSRCLPPRVCPYRFSSGRTSGFAHHRSRVQNSMGTEHFLPSPTDYHHNIII